MILDFLLFIIADIALTLYLIYRYRKYQEKKAMEYFMSLEDDEK